MDITPSFFFFNYLLTAVKNLPLASVCVCVCACVHERQILFRLLIYETRLMVYEKNQSRTLPPEYRCATSPVNILKPFQPSAHMYVNL